MIKLKDLLSETSISMGQVHSNPYASCFKSPEEIKPVNEGMMDLVIKRALEKDLKHAGIKVKGFKKDTSVMGKRAPNGKTIIWGGVFKTKNAVIPISVASEGSVFYQDRHIGVVNQGSKVKDNFRSLKVSNRWVESVNEAPAFSSPEAQQILNQDIKKMSGILGKASQQIIKIMMDGVKGGRYDAMDITRGIDTGPWNRTHEGDRPFMKMLWNKVRDGFRRYSKGGKLRK